MIRYTHTKPGLALLPDGISVVQEVVSRRTSHGKTFDLGGGKFRVRAGVSPCHYHDGKRWQDVDLTVIERNGELICDTAGYTVRLGKDIPRAIIESSVGDGDVELDKIPGGVVRANSVRLEGNEVIWEFDDDLSIHAELRPKAVEFYKRLGSDKSPRRFEWRVNKATKNVRLRDKSAGWDSERHNLQMAVSLEADRYIEEWTGKVGKIVDKKSRRKAWVNDAVWPVLVDTAIGIGITADADDGTQLNATTWVTRDVRCSFYYPDNIHAGFRFQGISVPVGSIISDAAIVIYCLNVGEGYAAHGSHAILYGDKIADAPAFSVSDLPADITKTTGKFTLPAVMSLGQKTLPVTQAVQSIVDLTGWASGNDMRFAMLQVGATASHWGAWFFADYPTPGYAVLDVFYTFYAGSVNPLHGKLG